MQRKDEDAGSGGIVPYVTKKHQGRAQQAFRQREKDGSRRIAAAGMLGWKSPEREVNQRQNQRHGDAAGCSVRKLNQSGDLRGMGNDLPTAQRPVIAAACAGAGGADDRTPQNHPDVVGEHEPGICREAASSRILAAFPHKKSMVTHLQRRTLAGLSRRGLLMADTRAEGNPRAKIPTDRSRIFSYSELSGRLMKKEAQRRLLDILPVWLYKVD